MKSSTERILMDLFALDNTIHPNVAKEAIAVLRAGGVGCGTNDDRGVDGETAATILGVSRRSVHNYANAGLIRRIGGRATKTRAKYSMQSIRDYMNGSTMIEKQAVVLT